MLNLEPKPIGMKFILFDLDEKKYLNKALWVEDREQATVFDNITEPIEILNNSQKMFTVIKEIRDEKTT